MTRPIVTIYDVVTQETEVREMNDEEFAQYEIDSKLNAERVAEQKKADAKAQAKADAKAVLLEKLGLTQDIIDILTN
jgi:hypothetical protein